MLLVAFIFFLARPVFALNLEVRYPSIPGVGSLEEGQELEDKGERLAFYARYVLRLVFYIVLGVCVVVLIIAGVMYITAGARPTVIVAAKAMVNRALLGLGILVGSYLVLYAINPQLLVLKLAIEEPETVAPSAAAEGVSPGEVQGYYINPTQVALETLDNASEELRYYGANDPRNDYNERYELITGQPGPQASRDRAGLLASILDKIAPSTVLASDSSVVPMVYRSEIPLRQTERIVEEMVELVRGQRDADNKLITPGLEDLLKECKCGQSKSHDEWGWEFKKTGDIVKTYSATFEGTCIGGMSEVQEGLHWKQYKEKTPQKICETNCDDCGTAEDPEREDYLSCDLREVRLSAQTVNIGTEKKNIELMQVLTDNPVKVEVEGEIQEIRWKYFDWEPIDWTPAPTWKPEDADARFVKVSADDHVDADRLIKYKRLRLQELLARLEGQKSKYFPEQVGPVDKTLANNAADYLLFNVKGGMFQNDFQAQKKDWERQGLIVKMEPIKSATGALDEKIAPPVAKQGALDRFLSFFIKPVSAQLARSTWEFDEGQFYFVVSAPIGVMQEGVTERNQFVYREAGRASLFSVLTDLSLEKIREMFQRCLTSAFGQADYQISDENMALVLKKALEGGVADEFIEQLKQNIPKVIEAIGKTYGDELQDRLDLECARQCGIENATQDELNQLTEEELKEFKERLNQFIEQNKECVAPCIKENLSPDFVSRTITGFLTADIDTWFGKEVKDALDGDIREFLGKDINRQLNKEMGKFYDAVLRGVLSQSLEEKIPGLKGLLETKLTEIKFLDVVLGRLKAVDEFLTCKISGCCRAVASQDECVEEIYNELPTDDKPIKQCCYGGVGGSCRNVASKRQCKKEVFREQGCCEQGLRQLIDGFAEDKVKALARKYTSEKAADVIGGFESNHPGLFPEKLPVDECFKRLKDGYRFVAKGGGEYECEKMSPETINSLATVFTGDPITGLMEFAITDETRQDICIGAGYCWSRDPDAGDIYEGDGEKMCRECNWIGQGFTRGQGAGGIKAGMKRLGRDFVAGLVNFGEQFISALVETTLHMAIAYAKVWIEDTITAPLMPYFKQVMKFQDTLHKYLNASVKDVLPGPIRETLEKNLDTLIADMCKAYKEQEEGCEREGKEGDACVFTFELAQYPWLRWEDDQGSPVPISFSKTSQISDNFGEKVCKLNKHLHTALLDEIAADWEFGAKVAEMLNNSIKEELAYACKVELAGKKYTCTELLEMSLADMVFAFTPLKNVIKLINGTPKQVICGELDVGWKKDDGTSGNNKATGGMLPSAKCKALLSTGQLGDLLSDSGDLTEFYKTLLSPINLTLPFLDKKSAAYKDLSSSEKKFYESYCPAIWGICQKIDLSSVIDAGVTIGAVMEQILDKGCSILAQTLEQGLVMEKTGNEFDKLIEKGLVREESGNKVRFSIPPPPCPLGADGADGCFNSRVCEGKCLSSIPSDPGLKALREDTDPQCLPVFKETCSGCNTLINNSMAFSLFYWAVKDDFVVSNDVYPLHLTVELTQTKEQEGEAYQWLYIYFPGLAQDIKNVALKRGFTPQEWLDLKDEVDRQEKVLSDYDFASADERTLLQSFIRGLSVTVKDILTDIPLGVVKPKTKGEATILKPAGRGESKNFLSKTPFGLLTNDVCSKVIYEFETDENLKYWSLPEVGIREELALGTAPRYSMDSLESSTLAKNLDIILHSPVSAEQKVPYLFCRVLKYSPAQVAGLNEKLMTYIRPKQAQIMFQLIEDKLHYSPDPAKNEMPKALKQLIDYLNTKTPSGALVDVARAISVEQGGQLKRLFSVRVDYRPDRDLQHILSDPGDAIKDAFRNNGLGLLDLYFYPLSFRIGDVDATGMGLYRDADHQDELGFYVIKTITDEAVFLVVYYDPAKLKSGINSLVGFLNTPIQGLMFERLAGREALFTPIIDTICQEPLEVPNTGPPPTVIPGWCAMGLDITRKDVLKAIENFLKQKPVDLLTKHLDDSLIDCEGDRCLWKKSISIMDWLVKKYPFLGQKYIDTLGRKLGWDKWLYNQAQGVGDAQKLIDNSMTNMQTAIQDQLNNALIEKPAQAVEYVTRKFAELIGGETGEKLASDLAGACSTVYTESACKQEGKIYRPGQGTEPSECCDLGANVVCEPRCRPKPEPMGCNLSLGEKEVQSPTPLQLGLHCCIPLFEGGTYDGDCKMCRLVPAVDDAEDRGCREGEAEEEIDGLKACCKPKKKFITAETDPISGEEYAVETCCTTVVDCVASQFDEHLRVLAETMAIGSLPLDSLTGER